jgi:hypothetical protein
MGAYETIDPAIAGLQYGLDNDVETWRAAEEIPFGRGVFGYVGDEKNAYLYKLDTSTTVFDADFVASNSIVATVNGVAVTAVVFDTDQATTMSNLEAQIEADISGAEATLTDTGGDNRTIAIFIKGVSVVVTWAVTGGASQPGDTVTTSSAQIFLGVSAITHREAAGTNSYKVKDAANILIKGKLYVLTNAAVNANTAAYVASADSLFSTSGYDTKSRYRSSIASAGLALVEVRGQN